MFIQTLRHQTRDLFIQKKLFLRSISVTSGAFKTKENENLKSWREIPGPSSLPVIGTLLHHLPGGSLYGLTGNDLYAKLYETYGPIVRLDSTLGMDPVIFLFDVETFEQILWGEEKMPVRPGFPSLYYYRNQVKNPKPDEFTGLATVDGEKWKKFRFAINPILLHPKTIRLHAKALDDVTLDMIKRLKLLRDTNTLNEHLPQEIDLWALESIALVALGSRIGCLTPNLPDDSPAKQLIRTLKEIFYVLEQLDIKPSLWKYFSTPTFRRGMEIFAKQESLTKHFIQQARKSYHNNPKPEEEKSVLEKLLDVDESVAVMMASDMLLAGVDTTANTILAALYLLAANEEKQCKLRHELKENPDSRSYLKACIKESMRMMPATTGNARITSREYHILGYRIPANLTVMCVNQRTSMMEKNFLRCNEYLPERWLVDKTDPLHYRNCHPLAYNPFGFGIRSCIGRRIAELEIETCLSRVVEHFHLQWNGPPPQFKTTTLNYFKGPFHFVFNEIKN